MATRIDALVLPGDEPADVNVIKKHLLFFDSLTLANPLDAAQINDRDIVEKFPNFEIWWASRNQFPRTEGYSEKFGALLFEVKHLQNRGIINLTSKVPAPNLDPGVDHSIWHSAVSDETLVKAAVPDCNMFIKPPLGIAGYAYNLVLSQGGYQSKYAIEGNKPMHIINGIDESWSYFAHLRLGRFLKFIRKAYGQGLVPISNDAANSSLLNTIGKTQLFSAEESTNDQKRIASLAFSMDVFDQESLNKSLAEMSWQDIERLRKITLPGMSELREHVIKSAKQIKQSSNNSDIDSYSDIVTKLKSDFESKKEKVSEEWEKLRIAAILKSGGVAGASGVAELSGLIGSTMTSPWIDILFKVLCGSLVASAAISTELKTLLPARNSLKQHPLYFTERIK